VTKRPDDSPILRDYGTHPEAYRETAVVPGEYSWRDRLANQACAQFDYDTRRLWAIESGRAMLPSQGMTFRDRIMFRGVVDAVLDGIRRLDAEDRRKALAATRAKK
jgi:hypothetical protein